MSTEAGLKAITLAGLRAVQFPPEEALLEPWFHKGHVSMVYSPTGLGKSFFVWSLALAVAGGGKFGEWSAPAPRRALIFDGEMPIHCLQGREGELREHLSIDQKAAEENLVLIARKHQDPAHGFLDLNKAEDQEKALGAVEEHGPLVSRFLRWRISPEERRAVLDAVASRVCAMVRRVGIEDEVILIGGMVHNPGFVQSLKGALGVDKVLLPEMPEYISALGAALIAAENNKA